MTYELTQWQNIQEKNEKQNRVIAFECTTSDNEHATDSENEAELDLIVKKFKKY